MQIKVNQYYQGFNTNEQVIKPGIYEVGDSRLYGIEDYLVNVQHKAEYVEDEAVESDSAKGEPVVEEPIITATQPHPEATEIEHKGRKVKVNPAKK
jgi:hypothetical protein